MFYNSNRERNLVYANSRNNNKFVFVDRDYSSHELEWVALLYAIRWANKKYTNCRITFRGSKKDVIVKVIGEKKIVKEDLRAWYDQCMGEVKWGESNKGNLYEFKYVDIDNNRAYGKLGNFINRRDRDERL